MNKGMYLKIVVNCVIVLSVLGFVTLKFMKIDQNPGKF